MGDANGPPSERELADALRCVGSDKITLDTVAGTATKLDADVYIDLSGIANGYAVDAVDAALAAAGWERTMVDVGGEVRTRGLTAFGRRWRVAIEQPDGGVPASPLLVSLVDHALVTSGNYRNFYFRGDTLVGHTIDLRTGRPIEHNGVSVSVMAADCMTADALATALMVMGPDAGLAWATDRDVAAVFMVRDNDTLVWRATPAYERQVGAELQ